MLNATGSLAWSCSSFFLFVYFSWELHISTTIFTSHFLTFFVLQFSKTNSLKINLPHIKLEEHGYATEEDVLISLKRAISRYSTLQAHDGHWPGDYAGTLFLLPSLVHSLLHLRTILETYHAIHNYITSHIFLFSICTSCSFSLFWFSTTII